MLEIISNEPWERLELLLPDDWQERENSIRYFPDTLPYQGRIPQEDTFFYRGRGMFPERSPGLVPPDELLQCLKAWMLTRGETKAFYFLIESCEGDEINFQASLDQLNYDALSEVNKLAQNIIAAQDYSWSIFIDEDGCMHIAGPKELYTTLNDCWNQLDEPGQQNFFWRAD